MDRVNAVYEEAGLLFPDNIRAQLGQVKDFHRRISENRQHHLQRELDAVEDRISNRYTQQNTLQERYSEIMRKLSDGGAFDEFRALLKRLTEKQSEFSDIQQQLENLMELKEERVYLIKAINKVVFSAGQSLIALGWLLDTIGSSESYE